MQELEPYVPYLLLVATVLTLIWPKFGLVLQFLLRVLAARSSGGQSRVQSLRRRRTNGENPSDDSSGEQSSDQDRPGSRLRNRLRDRLPDPLRSQRPLPVESDAANLQPQTDFVTATLKVWSHLQQANCPQGADKAKGLLQFVDQIPHSQTPQLAVKPDRQTATHADSLVAQPAAQVTSGTSGKELTHG